MEVVLFHIRTRADIDEGEYERAFEEMVSEVSQIPGYVSIEAFSGQDGSELALALFDSPAAIEAWRTYPGHLKTQERGRNEFFDRYEISIATVWKRYHWSTEEGRVVELSP